MMHCGHLKVTLRTRGTKCVLMLDDIPYSSLNESSLQVKSKFKLGIQKLKEEEETEVRAVIGKWSQMEYEVRQSTW